MSHEKLLASIIPAPIDDQIKEIEREIVIVEQITSGQVQRGTLHPNNKAIRMHRLRSILLTLRNVREQGRPQEVTT